MENLLVVGGNIETGKRSEVIYKIFCLYVKLCHFVLGRLHNGTLPENLNTKEDLVLWFPDISNEHTKTYPKKKKGSVLICSKVMRDNTTRIDAVSRIFAMQGNAIVLIYKNQKPFKFELVDALNNTWCLTDDIEVLVNTINELYTWTKKSVRISLKQKDLASINLPKVDCSSFIEINKKLALKVAEGCGNRFFGNYSTRCTKLFPSERNENMFLFSPRNVDKRFVTEDDLIAVTDQNYFGDRKPSVDTPVQLKIYTSYPNINFMIHGHALIDGAPTTKHYFPCGDLREVDEVLNLVEEKHTKRINLKNHGFLLLGETEEDMRIHLEECNFKSL